MKVSYLVTCSTETDSLRRLLETLTTFQGNDHIVVLTDSKTINGSDIKKETFDIVEAFKGTPHMDWVMHPLDNNYGEHKNYGIRLCHGEFIFQIDGDEHPPEALLGDNIHDLLDSNPDVEAYAVPRINDFRGVKPEHARQWGWRLTESPTYKRPVVNWPDHQWRIFKKDFPRISFTRRLHEKIEGYLKYVILPAEEDYALYHDKTIETQLATNKRYNEMFTLAENQGHNPYK